MPIVAATVKIAALAVALTCIGARRPVFDEAPRSTMRDASSARLQCRMYFGCAPTLAVNASVAQRQQEYVR
jgi:hypothetical protein